MTNPTTQPPESANPNKGDQPKSAEEKPLKPTSGSSPDPYETMHMPPPNFLAQVRAAHEAIQLEKAKKERESTEDAPDTSRSGS